MINYWITQLPIVYQYQNYLDMEYENEFDIATLIFCDFGVLSPENRAILLRKISQTFLEQYLIVKDDDCQCFNIWNQAFCADTLKKELTSAGFSDMKFYGNVCGDLKLEDSKTLCAVAYSR